MNLLHSVEGLGGGGGGRVIVEGAETFNKKISFF
jgi:hypothetical protein